MILLIAAVAENGVIGRRNDLPWRLSSDLRRFKELTTGHTVVMGRRTLESIVGRLGHALPDRRSIVLSRQQVSYPGVEVLHDIGDIRFIEGDIFVIGGADIYEQTIDMADRLYLTEVKAEVDGDVLFPSVDRKVWREVWRESHSSDEKNDYDFDFVIYDRVR